MPVRVPVRVPFLDPDPKAGQTTGQGNDPEAGQSTDPDTDRSTRDRALGLRRVLPSTWEPDVQRSARSKIGIGTPNPGTSGIKNNNFKIQRIISDY